MKELFFHPLPEPPDHRAPAKKQQQINTERQLCGINVPVQNLLVIRNIRIIVRPGSEIQVRIQPQAPHHDVYRPGNRQNANDNGRY